MEVANLKASNNYLSFYKKTYYENKVNHTVSSNEKVKMQFVDKMVCKSR